MQLEIIAELHPQHGGDKDVIRKMIKDAKINGAQVAKFQLYDASKLFTSRDWDYLELKKEDVAELIKWCKEEDIEFMASIFDHERLGWCEELGVKRYKIASRTVTEDNDLCKAILNTGKETIVSLGMWKENIKPFGENPKIKYLYCIAKYPTLLEDVTCFPEDFKKEGLFGYSDHTIGIEMSLLAIARGANIIEKHFTLDKTRVRKTEKAHICSMTPEDLKILSTIGSQMFRNREAISKTKRQK